jgi:hypothetical protein
MSAPDSRSWQETLKKLKVDFDKSTGKDTLNQIEVDPQEFFPWSNLQQRWQQILTWFQSVPSSGKLAVGLGGAILAFVLIETVFKIVSSLLTLAVIGIICYGVYRLWIAPKE